jgi:hypothetical protein
MRAVQLAGTSGWAIVSHAIHPFGAASGGRPIHDSPVFFHFWFTLPVKMGYLSGYSLLNPMVPVPVQRENGWVGVLLRSVRS